MGESKVDDRLMSLETAAELNDVSVKTLRRWMERGLPWYRNPGSAGKRWLRQTDILEYAEENLKVSHGCSAEALAVAASIFKEVRCGS